MERIESQPGLVTKLPSTTAELILSTTTTIYNHCNPPHIHINVLTSPSMQSNHIITDTHDVIDKKDTLNISLISYTSITIHISYAKLKIIITVFHQFFSDYSKSYLLPHPLFFILIISVFTCNRKQWATKLISTSNLSIPIFL